MVTLCGMWTITIKELHARTGEWVRKAGEKGEITVTDRGHPVAVILPFPSQVHPINVAGNAWKTRGAGLVYPAPAGSGPAGQENIPLFRDVPVSGQGMAANPFLNRRLLPGFADIQPGLHLGTDTTVIISEDRERE